jgi:hypothetical protein
MENSNMNRSLIALGFAALVGCNSSGSGDVKLGVDVSALTASVANAVTSITAADSSLVISRIRVLVAHAKVGYTGKQAGGAQAEIGPVVVELTADEIASGAHRDFDLGSLPSGTYGGAEIEIQPLDSTADTSDPALADFVTSKASVLVEGTYQGTAFTFAGHFLAEQGTDGDVTIDAAVPLNLAMTVDPTGWFVDANGAAINPADATLHGATALAICKTLDTQPVLTESAPTGGGGHPGGHGGGPGGGDGNQAHCVEPAQ